MHLFYRSLILAATVSQTLGLPAEPIASRATGPLDDWIAKESTLAKQLLLANIGAGGINDRGSASGLIVASPSDTNPNYCYTWTRDSALTFKLVVDTFIAGDTSLESTIQDYVVAQARLQTIETPSGGLSTGGLAEPKYNLDETAFTGPWGRPQRDGPALRTTALIAYGRYLIANGKSSVANDILWPIISNDLSYVMGNWNQTTFDLWEEVKGSSFFATAVQHRALVEGAAFATSIGKSCPGCVDQAPQVLCFLQSYWNGEYLVANTNTNDGRSGKDSNTILGSIHTFDTEGGCDASTFQPCSDKALANLKVYVDSFRSIYRINSGKGAGVAAAVGRYPEDVYFNGNPWYISTAAVAEQLYDAIYQWNKLGSITVTSTSLPFFKDFQSSIAVGTYKSGSPTFDFLTSAVKTYADGFLIIFEQFTPSNGSISEQFDRNTGTPLSAYDLTWSFASFLTAGNARKNIHPASWGEQTANIVPSKCVASSFTGPYATPTATVFPVGTSTPPCPANSVSFTIPKATTFGEAIFVTGNISSLGQWSTTAGVKLSADKYTLANPLWETTVGFAPGVDFAYKYYKTNTDGSVSWEAGPNREFTVGRQCAGPQSVLGIWRD